MGILCPLIVRGRLNPNPNLKDFLKVEKKKPQTEVSDIEIQFLQSFNSWSINVLDSFEDQGQNWSSWIVAELYLFELGIH